MARWWCDVRVAVVAIALVVATSGCGAEEAVSPVLDPSPTKAVTEPTAMPPPAPNSAPTLAPEPTTAPSPAETPTAEPPTTETAPADTSTETGAAVLVANDFRLLHGQRVGLIAHQASVVAGERLADLIDRHPQVELAALFAPEHGLFGTADAGEATTDATDPETGTPVFSLYGLSRSPTPQALSRVDVLVYDLQDVGTRFYTYTSTLGLAMQAAAEAGVPFVVLDRPNPIGGAFLQGPTLPNELTSFIGMYPIPSGYALTAGELARLIQAESLVAGLETLDLTVVEMVGWSRAVLWPDTGLPWVPPSPNLPTFESALLYPGTVLFEATSISEGRGTTKPFQLIGVPWVDGEAVAAAMNGRGLPGVQFRSMPFEPRSIPGAASSPRYEGQQLGGVFIEVTNPTDVEGLAVGLHLLDELMTQAAAAGISRVEIIDRPDVFDRLAGSPRVRQSLVDEVPIAEIIESFAADHAAFRNRTADIVLYDD